MKKNILLIAFVLLTISAFSQWNKGSISLDIELKSGAFGIPKGYISKGNDIYIDFDSNTTETVAYQTEPSNSNWDIVFTYINFDVSMGPMGVNPIPFFDIKVNADSGVTFYMLEGESFSIVDENRFVGSDHKGYGHRKWKDNKRLEDPEYKTVYPYMSYDWYQFEKMTKFKMGAYQPKRTFIFKTSEGNFVEFYVDNVTGEKEGKIYHASYEYQLLN